MNYYYRFIVSKIGIYEAVESDCPRTYIRRKNKPDSSWLAKVGKDYPKAISFWTKEGLRRYIQSGLMERHTSVVKGKVEVIIAQEPNKILYKDEDQIIIEQNEVSLKKKLSLEEFLKNKNNHV